MTNFQILCAEAFEQNWNAHRNEKFCKELNCYCNLNNCEECLKEAGIKN